MPAYLAVAVGGAFGAVARFGIDRSIEPELRSLPLEHVRDQHQRLSSDRRRHLGPRRPAPSSGLDADRPRDGSPGRLHHLRHVRPGEPRPAPGRPGGGVATLYAAGSVLTGILAVYAGTLVGRLL